MDASDWATNENVDAAVEEYVSYLKNFPKRKNHVNEGWWCLDK